MRLQLMSWPEAQSYLSGSVGILLPVGATEQHGPSGLLGTDAICAEALAWRAGELAGAAVGPTLTVGMSEHHMGFPGTMTLRPSTLVLVVRDVVLSLARHGFRRLMFVNGHGGNTASIQAGFFEAYAEAATLVPGFESLRCACLEWWTLDSACRLSRELFGDRDGDHASASEVSLAAAAFPDHLKQAELTPNVAPTSWVFGPDDFRRRYPDGRMGSHPELASTDHGRTILEEVAGELAQRYRAFVDEL